ncbi:MAG TPA: GAF domain-containing protein, partial [bacterium]|nr:GAF domain-containing protein [bacterium]
MLDRALAESELLNVIATSAAGEHDITKILDTALDKLRRVINFTGGSIALVEGDTLVLRAVVGPFAEAALGQRMARGSGRSWQIIERGEPFLSGSVADEGMRPTTPITSYLAVPLVWQGTSFGLLEVDSTEAHAFDEDDLALLQRVALVLSGPVELARRYSVEVRALAEAEAAGRRLTLLAEASSILAASLDYEVTLANIARLAVPTIADWCIVDLVDDQGTIRQVGIAHVDPTKESLVRELRLRYPPKPNPEHVIMRVLRSGKSELTPDITEADLKARARDKTHFKILRSLDIHSDMVIPLIARGRTLGAISFIRAKSRPQYSAVDLSLAEEIAARAAVAIDNAHLFAAERQARAETEDALRRVHAANRLIAMAASALDLGQVFDEFGEVLRTLVPFVRFTVSLYVPESDTLTMPFFKGPRLEAPPEKLEGPKAGSARGWVIDHGEAFIREDTYQARQFAEDSLLAESGIRSYVIVPMTVGGRIIGTMNFGHDVPGFYTTEHARLSRPIADQLGLTVSRFELFEQVRRKAGELSSALQRALLPAELPRLPFLAIAALYQAADPEARVGGDWYDALLLPDDRLLISIGDVAGHGIAAAAAMAQVRHLVRALAIQGRRPADVMAAVNHYLLQLPDSTHLSMWIAMLDPITGDLIYGGAGHPPVLVQGAYGV